MNNKEQAQQAAEAQYPILSEEDFNKTLQHSLGMITYASYQLGILTKRSIWLSGANWQSSQTPAALPVVDNEHEDNEREIEIILQHIQDNLTIDEQEELQVVLDAQPIKDARHMKDSFQIIGHDFERGLHINYNNLNLFFNDKGRFIGFAPDDGMFTNCNNVDNIMDSIIPKKEINSEERWKLLSNDSIDKLLKLQIEECRIHVDRCSRDVGQSSAQLNEWILSTPVIDYHKTVPVVSGGEKMYDKPKIYIASKTKHADKWIKLRDEGVDIISTWIDEAGIGETSDLSELSHRCIQESKECDAMIVYAKEEDYLKGAFIEMGAALAFNKPIYLVGSVLPSSSCFAKNTNVHICTSIESAIGQILSRQSSQPPASVEGEKNKWHKNMDVFIKAWIEKMMVTAGLETPSTTFPEKPESKFFELISNSWAEQREKWLCESTPVTPVRSAEEVTVQDILDSDEFKERFELMGSNQFLSKESYKSYLANMKLAKESFIEGLKFYASQFKGTTPAIHPPVISAGVWVKGKQEPNNDDLYFCKIFQKEDDGIQ